MNLRGLFRRQTVNDEATRRTRLLSAGRITEARVFDAKTDATGAVTEIYYSYTVAGADYEASEKLNAEQQNRAADYAPGALITIRYDPRQHGNSIVV